MPQNFGNGRVIPAAIILGTASLLSRFVGLVRERVLTTTFGAGDVFDAFVAAFRVPDLIFNLIVLGALSAAFIPIFTEKLVQGKKGEKQAFDFATSVLNAIVIVVGLMSGVYFLLADKIVPVITPGFGGEKLALTIMLSKAMALQPVLLCISFVFSGMLNSYKRFVVYALAPILYNLGIIIGVFLFVPIMGIVGIAWGVVLGAAAHMLVQLPSIWQVGYRWKPIVGWSTDDFHKLWRMMLPRIVGLAAMQVNLVTVTVIGSSMLAGSIAVFHLANNVQYLPVGIFGISFAQAAFPTLAEQIARRQKAEFSRTLTRIFRYIMFLVVPTSLFFFLLRAQIIRVLFGDGAFDWEDTILTFDTFGWLVISIFAQATIPLLVRAFYVQQDTKTPVVISIISMVVNIGLALYLAPIMGVQGLALAFSASAIVNLMLLLGVLHWQLKGFDDKAVILSLVKIVLAALGGGMMVQVLKYPVAAVVDMQRFWGVLMQLVVAGSGGVAVYLLLTWLLKSEEIIVLRKYLPQKPALKKIPAGTDTPRWEGLAE
ncbi:MAG: murein biosynthesis integral membrane protein MurJ [Candidatus Andersenbacteria bacterium RIFCSPHIGHO2_12_FULL_46_9]|nr:MAG: murein biosynthesis integral membrane protein MurJ [Candidatus Andersenbacteria bacterium RIFCSPHIGHO2_02_FULL_46_16]OGY36274.1 MAG: murein biosynthesis integral membrane protein MurJ [Candidatus Andersenbacteria bacterium RIFCSPLOWO2_02_FULL_46_11]OGY37080.1 MAG: murein biosynthesis integral membrane protein MurJ [Candidatus Andersenbacteria bacterium RIFCSPHIGHO2_12_FULL_46_9]OGY42266.1 MAG: murein biosynthesis integral membrane protein MurJ [Candidatus Andersenbacteria bacterium RIFCS